MDDDRSWLGRGEDSAHARTTPPPKVNWITLVNYEGLIDCIHRADVCLGIFGDTDKTARVIPNKVFHILTAGATLVTRDSKAIRELVSAENCGLAFVPPADPAALVAAIKRIAGEVSREDRPLHRSLVDRIVPIAIAERLITLINELSAPLSDGVGS